MCCKTTEVVLTQLQTKWSTPRIMDLPITVNTEQMVQLACTFRILGKIWSSTISMQLLQVRLSADQFLKSPREIRKRIMRKVILQAIWIPFTRKCKTKTIIWVQVPTRLDQLEVMPEDMVGLRKIAMLVPSQKVGRTRFQISDRVTTNLCLTKTTTVFLLQI